LRMLATRARTSRTISVSTCFRYMLRVSTAHPVSAMGRERTLPADAAMARWLPALDECSAPRCRVSATGRKWTPAECPQWVKNGHCGARLMPWRDTSSGTSAAGRRSCSPP
jgi:hypothetical protein